MPVPNLIHPTEFRVRPADRAATIADSSLREPVQVIKRKAELIISAQTNMREDGHGQGLMPVNEREGYGVDEAGYLLVRRRDIEAIGYVPVVGDEYTEISMGEGPGITLRAYLTRVVYMGHYPKLGYTLLKLFFKSRKPARPD